MVSYRQGVGKERPGTALRLVCLSCVETDPKERGAFLREVMTASFEGLSSAFLCSLHPTEPYLRFRFNTCPQPPTAGLDAAPLLRHLRRHLDNPVNRRDRSIPDLFPAHGKS